jgi:hypothetical protein
MDNEASIGTVVDKITCAYLRHAVITNIRPTMSKAIEAGFPEEWVCHLDLLKGHIIWICHGLPCEIHATPAAGPGLFDTDISLSVELYTPSNLHAPVQEIDKLQSLVDANDLDAGLQIPMDWSGDPDNDALAYLMAIKPILSLLGSE